MKSDEIAQYKQKLKQTEMSLNSLRKALNKIFHELDLYETRVMKISHEGLKHIARINNRKDMRTSETKPHIAKMIDLYGRNVNSFCMFKKRIIDYCILPSE